VDRMGDLRCCGGRRVRRRPPRHPSATNRLRRAVPTIRSPLVAGVPADAELSRVDLLRLCPRATAATVTRTCS
jgi:hypothetical protein